MASSVPFVSTSSSPKSSTTVLQFTFGTSFIGKHKKTSERNHNNCLSFVWLHTSSYYEELKEVEEVCVKENQDLKHVQEAYESELAVRRRRARSMTERQVMQMLDDGRNLISASTIESMLHQLSAQLDGKTSRSLDTLLGLMAAEAEKDDILNLYDDFYTTDEDLTVAERTKKLLKLTALEIEHAKKRKEDRMTGLCLVDGPLKSKLLWGVNVRIDDLIS